MNNELTQKKLLHQDPKAHDFVQDPYGTYRQLHVTGSPVFWKDYGFWCIPSFADVNSILRDKRFARRPPAGHERPAMPPHLAAFASTERYSLLSLEPPEHTRLRKSVNRAFAGRQIDQMASDISALAHQCIDDMESLGPCDLLQHYATPIPVTVITQLLGVPLSAANQLVEWSHAMVRVYTLTQSLKDEHEANQAASEFQAFLQSLIHEKRQQPGKDLLTQLLSARVDDEPLTDQQIISVAILLLNAGQEATVHQLGNAVKTLLQEYPVEQRHLLHERLADDTQSDALVAECMRFAAPLHLFMRYAQETLSLADGTTIQAGEQVGLLLAAANRCPRQFSSPDTFDPARQDSSYLSLGAGLHFCVGAQLAKLELRIALQVLFKRLPALQLDEQPEYQNAYHFHGLKRLQVRW